MLFKLTLKATDPARQFRLGNRTIGIYGADLAELRIIDSLPTPQRFAAARHFIL
jgi:hypothetical protein